MPRSAPDSCRDDLGSAACLSIPHRHQDAAAILRARRLDHTIEFPILWTYSLLEPLRFVYRLKDDGRGGAGIVFAVTAEREAAYYIFTLALPMTLILFLAWMTHWLPVDITPPRMGMASATVFSLIAFGVSFRLTLPKIAYLTDADRFVLYSTLLVLVSLAVAVATVRWAHTDRKNAAERLARQTRLAFPLLYGLIILLTVVI
jgi:hypothetical protein